MSKGVRSTFLLYIDEDLKKELEKEAKSMRISLSSYIRMILSNRKK